MKNEAGNRIGIGPWLALAMGLLFIALAGWRTIGPADVWHHLAIGRHIAEHGLPRTDPLSFVAAERAWTNVNWLYDVTVHAVWRGAGAAGVTALHVAAVVGGLILGLLAARRRAGPLSAAFALLLAGWMLAPVFMPRPDVLAVIFPAYFLLVLSSPRRPAALWTALLPVQVLWANLDSSFILGPLLTLFAALEARFAPDAAEPASAAAGARARGIFLLTGGLLLATMLNPRGPMVFAHALAPAFRASSRLFEIWVSPYSGHFAPWWGRHAVTVALALGALGLVVHRSRLPLLLTAAAIVSAFLVIRSISYLPLFAVMSFPFLCISVRAIGTAAARPAKTGAGALHGTAAAAAVAAALAAASAWSFAGNGYYRAVGAASRFGTGVATASMPEGVVDVLRRYPVLDRVFHFPVDGGYLAWSLPGRRVFTDLRGDVYGAEFARLVRRVAAGEGNIRDLVFARWNIDAVALNGSAPGADALLRSLLESGTWALAYFDGTCAVAVPRTSKYEDLLSDAALQADGLRRLNEAAWQAEAALASGRPAEVSGRLVGGAFLLSALDRHAAAARIFRLMLASAPRMEGARFHLAVCQAKLGQLDVAEQNLLTLTRNRRYASDAWRWLAHVYRRQGRATDAEAAATRAAALARPAQP